MPTNTNNPYFLKGKGIKPGGVFVRQGTSSVPATFEQIRRMIKENDGDTFEEMRSLNQELTFDEADRAFSLATAQCSMDIGESFTQDKKQEETDYEANIFL